MGSDAVPSGGRRGWFSILRGIAVLCLWIFAIGGPILSAFGVASFFTDVEGLEMFGQPVGTFRDRLLFTGSTLFLSVVGLSYVLIWRKRAWQDRRVMWAYMAVIYLGVPLMDVSMLAYHYKSLLDSVYHTTVEIRSYDAETGGQIPIHITGPSVGLHTDLPRWGSAALQIGAMEISVMATRPVKFEVGSPGYTSQDIEIGPDTDEIVEVRLRRAENFTSERNRPDR